jgi:probable rRNA maturation factor
MPSHRPVLIANQHPRLRFNRGAAMRLMRALDNQFHVLPAERPHLNRRRSRAGKKFPGAKFPSVSGVLESEVPPGDLSLVFLTDAALARLHADFLGDPTSTDVITFEGDPALGVAGEICVSVDTAVTYARKHRRDFNAELTLYLIHGWLHLAGYDDLQPARKRVMRRAEARAMKIVAGIPHCDAGFRLLPLPSS